MKQQTTNFYGRNDKHFYVKTPLKLIYCKELSNDAKVLWIILADCKPEKWTWRLSQMAEKMGKSVRQTNRYLSELRKAGFIKRIAINKRLSITNIYWYQLNPEGRDKFDEETKPSRSNTTHSSMTNTSH